MTTENKLFDENDIDILEEVMKHRRDVRGNRFTNDPVSDEVIDKILTAALYAPSVGFSQPWEFVVIRDENTKSKVVETFNEENEKAARLFTDDRHTQYLNLRLEGITAAPVNIAVFYTPNDVPVLGQTSMAEVGPYSVVCAVQNMWLMARALNIGIGWVSILDPERVKQVLHAPQGHQLIAYLCVGYVNSFLDKPELELKRWEQRKLRNKVVLRESYKP